jgi:hypothetical protein
LHAGVAIAASEREQLERLCRYVSRPPVATERLALTASGRVRYTLKTPYRDGTTHLVLEPLELMARLAALVTPPTPRHAAMSWAKRLQRVFGIEIDTCQRCGGTLRIIASIEQREVIARIRSHLERMAPKQYKHERSLGARGRRRCRPRCFEPTARCGGR